MSKLKASEKLGCCELLGDCFCYESVVFPAFLEQAINYCQNNFKDCYRRVKRFSEFNNRVISFKELNEQISADL